MGTAACLAPTVAALLAAVLTSCATPNSEDEPDGRGTATVPTRSASPSPTTDQSAGAVLRRWQDETVAKQTGKWSVDHGLGALGEVSQEGAYDLDPVSLDVATVVNYVNDAYFTFRANADGRWLQWKSRDVGFGRCWIDLDTTPQLKGSPVATNEPPAVKALLTATKPRYADENSMISVQADLRTVLLLVASPIQTEWLPPREGLATTTVLANVEDGEITGWEANLKDVLTDTVRAGYPAPNVRPAGGGGLWLTVTFEDVGKPVVVTAPPDRLIRSVDSDLSREASLAGCGVD